MFKFFSTSSLVLASLWLAQSAYAGTLSCSITTQAICNSTASTTILRMSNSSNAHSALPGLGGTAYDNNVVCCTGVTGLSNSCASTATTTVLRLSGASGSNAHVEQKSLTNANYNTSLACIGVGAGGTVSTGYVSSGTCSASGWDTTLASMSSTTNAHVGTSTAYTIKVCANATGGVVNKNATSTLVSSVFDTNASSTYNSIMWNGNLPAGTNVRFQFAVSNCSGGQTDAGCTTGSWGSGTSGYIGGPTCANTDWFVPSAINTPVELIGSGAQAGTCRSNFNNKRYYRYKVQLCSSTNCDVQGPTTPRVDKIVVNWSP